jgi:hypothetical protein
LFGWRLGRQIGLEVIHDVIRVETNGFRIAFDERTRVKVAGKYMKMAPLNGFQITSLYLRDTLDVVERDSLFFAGPL